MATRGSFPHPVLDASDDVSADFRVFNISYVPAVEDVEVTASISMTDARLQELIDIGRARYSVRWSCGRTLSGGELAPVLERQLVDGHVYSFSIDQKLIRGPVSIEFRIVAATSISDYRLENQHPDYGDARFDIQAGDLLGDGGRIEIHPTKLYDPLNPPLGSCFSFQPAKTIKRGFEVSFLNPEYVLVQLAPGLHASLGANGMYPRLQIATVVLPALMEALTYMATAEASGDADELESTEWYPALSALRARTGLSSEEGAAKIAQKMLNYTTDSALAEMVERFDGDEDD